MTKEELKALRLKLGLTQQEMAERLCLESRQAVYFMESGKRGISRQTAQLARQLDSGGGNKQL